MKVIDYGIVHKISHCDDCLWDCEDYQKDVKKLSKEHAIKNKHTVHVEYGESVCYDGKQ